MYYSVVYSIDVLRMYYSVTDITSQYLYLKMDVPVIINVNIIHLKEFKHVSIMSKYIGIYDVDLYA